jgi:hypothetical protein
MFEENLYYFFDSDDYLKLQLLTRENNNKSKVKEILKNKKWVFNKFSNIGSKIINQPLLLSQILVSKFLNFFNTKTKSIEELKDSELEFLNIKEESLDLTVINLNFSNLTEKICFWINIFNSLIIHSTLSFLLEGLKTNSPQEYDSFLNICSYEIGKFNILNS